MERSLSFDPHRSRLITVDSVVISLPATRTHREEEMTQTIEADLSTPKARERELYTIPLSSSWFRWDDIHETERKSLPEFFDGGSYSRSPRVYKEYRDFIINKYRENPALRLTFTEIRKSLVGDVGTLRKVFLFLEKWGLINFSAPDGKKRPPQPPENGGGLMVVVEDGPSAGVRVVPAVSSSSSAATEQAGGDDGFRLPPLASYSDCFGEWRPGNGLVCGLCGVQSHLGCNDSFKDGIAICSKCSNKDTESAEVEEDLNSNDHVDEKNKSSAAWTDAEILLLLEAVLKHGDDWDLVAQHVRTKNKLDCISRLIHLPFGEHMLGMINTKLNTTNVVILPEESTSSLQVSNDNPPVLTETDGEQNNEIAKDEGGEIASQVHPSKRRCFPSFTDTADTFMSQLACLSTVCGPHVAAAAVEAATNALCHENPCAITAFQTYGDMTTNPTSSPFKNEFKSETKVEFGDAKRTKRSDYAPEKKFGATIFRIRAAIATALGVAAARAKLVADQEEREAELLMASIIQAQLKKVQYKMKLLTEVEAIMERELWFVRQEKENLMQNWVELLEQLFRAGIPRWRDKGTPKAFPNAAAS